MIGRSAHRVQGTGWRFLVAGLVAVVATVATPGVGSAATVSDTATVTIPLDSPGTVTLDAFDPAQGSLTGVALSLRADVLVQVCIENAGQAQASMGAGTATAILTAEFPDGATRTVADVDATVAAASLAPSNGTANCASGYNATDGRFPATVTASDTTYVQQTDQATDTATLTTTAAMAPFNRAGTVTITYTAQSDTKFALPAAWDNLSVAQGQLQATVTYTYTPTTSGGGSRLPFTGSTGSRIAAVAAITVLAGITAVLVARHRRTNRTTPPPATP